MIWSGAQHYLMPGEVYWGEDPRVLVTTILGSCVAVTLHDAEERRGGILHALLPARAAAGSSGVGTYLDTALPFLLERLHREGSSGDRLIASVFGGASMLPSGWANSYAVGRQNTERAIRMLEEYRVRVALRDVGGLVGRKILFHPSSGRTYRKFLRATSMKSGGGSANLRPDGSDEAAS